MIPMASLHDVVLLPISRCDDDCTCGGQDISYSIDRVPLTSLSSVRPNIDQARFPHELYEFHTSYTFENSKISQVETQVEGQAPPSTDDQETPVPKDKAVAEETPHHVEEKPAAPLRRLNAKASGLMALSFEGKGDAKYEARVCGCLSCLVKFCLY